MIDLQEPYELHIYIYMLLTHIRYIHTRCILVSRLQLLPTCTRFQEILRQYTNELRDVAKRPRSFLTQVGLTSDLRWAWPCHVWPPGRAPFTPRHSWQVLNLGCIVFSALMLWKGLMVVTKSESPVVVVPRDNQSLAKVKRRTCEGSRHIMTYLYDSIWNLCLSILTFNLHF